MSKPSLANNPPSTPHPLEQRLKMLRKVHGLSLEALAERTGLTKSYLSKVERGLSEPSIGSVLKLCRAFGITTGQLLGEEPSAQLVHIVRRNERTPLTRLANYEGYVYEAIANNRADKMMLPFVMRPLHNPAKAAELVEHRGQELIFVLKGEIELRIAQQVVRLKAGDAAYFDAALPHRSISVGPTQAEALVVVAGSEAKDA